MADFNDTRVAIITYSYGDGTYTATEVFRDAADSAWEVAVAPSGLVDFTLREINNSTALDVDDIVTFWVALGKGESWRYFCELSLDTQHLPGEVWWWAGPIAAIPAGSLHCDGSSLLRSSYTALFAAIATIYGAADGTHFTIPELRNHFIAGAHSDSGCCCPVACFYPYCLTQTGGFAEHGRIDAGTEINNHDDHLVPSSYADGATYDCSRVAYDINYPPTYEHSITDNAPPWLALVPCIKT